MKRKYFFVMAIFASVFIIATAAVFSLSDDAEQAEDVRAEQLVALNEISQLMKEEKAYSPKAAQKIMALEQKIRSGTTGR